MKHTNKSCGGSRLLCGVVICWLANGALPCAAVQLDEASQVHSTNPLNELPIGRVFSTTDSLGKPADSREDAMMCLAGLCWQPEAFDVACVTTTQSGVDAVLRFPSARPTGDETNDTVVAEWYAVKDADGKLVVAPAIVVVHESGRGMTVGRMVARGLRDRGIHSFMIQLPYYGLRRFKNTNAEDHEFAAVMSQGIADVRRTRDAVAVLPGVDRKQISLQGTSLGGFVAATTAGLDSSFSNVFILLAGGNLPQLLTTGTRETAQLRATLEKQGFTGERLHELLHRFEPNRLAHRIDANRLWLYSGTFDTVVPAAQPESFAKAAGLDESHHLRMPATHVSGLIFLPMILDDIATKGGGSPLVTK